MIHKYYYLKNFINYNYKNMDINYKKILIN